MRKLYHLYTIAVTLTLLAIACGGGSSNHSSTGTSPSVPAKVQSAIQAIPGMHVFGQQTKTSFNFSLVPEANAQVTTAITLSQSWNGVCNLNFAGVTQSASSIVYGLGQYSSQNCTDAVFFDTNGQNAANSAHTGQLVVGNGTLSNLVAYTSAGTQIVSNSGVLVHVWVKRGGSVTDTGLSCSLPVGSDFLKCGSSTTFQALDGDLVVATFTFGPSDKIVGLNVVFTKV